MAEKGGFLRLLFGFWLRRWDRDRDEESIENEFMEAEEVMAAADPVAHDANDEVIDLMAAAEEIRRRGGRGRKSFGGRMEISTIRSA